MVNHRVLELHHCRKQCPCKLTRNTAWRKTNQVTSVCWTSIFRNGNQPDQEQHSIFPFPFCPSGVRYSYFHFKTFTFEIMRLGRQRVGNLGEEWRLAAEAHGCECRNCAKHIVPSKLTGRHCDTNLFQVTFDWQIRPQNICESTLVRQNGYCLEFIFCFLGVPINFRFHLEGWAFFKLFVSIRLRSNVKTTEHKNKSSFLHHN